MNQAHQFLRVLFFTSVCALAWEDPASGQEIRYEIHFPNPPGYQTLACDLHMHTVFSDGLVWPTVRVDEAWRQGLDVISVTDHVEYQPHKDDIKTNHHRPFELVKDTARSVNMLLIRGTELTRDTPPGHFNALFLEKIDKLETPEFLDAIKAAHDQGAFVFWNHQAWKGEEKGSWLDVHTTMFDNNMFQGMEVCNGETYFPTAHKWCLEKNLTMLGNSDIHDPDLRKRSTADDHRTMTLAFVTEKTPAALKEALLAGRTAVWYKDQLIGRQEQLEPLFYGAVQIQVSRRAIRKIGLAAGAQHLQCGHQACAQRRQRPGLHHTSGIRDRPGPNVHSRRRHATRPAVHRHQFPDRCREPVCRSC